MKQPRQLLPTEDVLELLDKTVAELSYVAVEFAARMSAGDELPCLYQWHKLEKAARSVVQAGEIENEALGAISLMQAKKELVTRALALADCLQVTGGEKDAQAPNLRQPGRKTRKHPWGGDNDRRE